MARVPKEATPYLDALVAHAADDPANFNVPGHKAGLAAPAPLAAALGRAALALDIPPVIHGVDTGVDPNPRDEAHRLAASAWGAARTWFLVNGASQANHTICLAFAQRGRSVVVQRNIHASTVDGIILADLDPVFVAPEIDLERGAAHLVTPAALDRALARADAPAGVVVVSPTYNGMAADVRELVDVAHAHGVPIAIDEAWGAHFPFHEGLPLDALRAGADLVVSSTHKMLGSLTQSAMLHLGSTELVAEEEVDRALKLTQTTSPNALLAASLDAARRRAAVEGRSLLGRTILAARTLREQIRAIPGLDVLDDRLVGSFGIAGTDPLHLAIDVRDSGRDGYAIQQELRRSGVLVELTTPTLIVAIRGMGEGERAAQPLVDGLRRAVGAQPQTAPRGRAVAIPPAWGELVESPRAAFLSQTERVPLDAAVGRIAAESLAVFPPGIPNVMPGERVTQSVVAHVTDAVRAGAVVRGCGDPALTTLRVVAGRQRQTLVTGRPALVPSARDLIRRPTAV